MCPLRTEELTLPSVLPFPATPTQNKLQEPAHNGEGQQTLGVMDPTLKEVLSPKHQGLEVAGLLKRSSG